MSSDDGGSVWLRVTNNVKDQGRKSMANSDFVEERQGCSRWSKVKVWQIT